MNYLKQYISGANITALLIALMPTYLIRFQIGPIPTTLFEIAIYLTIAGTLIFQPKQTLQAIKSALTAKKHRLSLIAHIIFIASALYGITIAWEPRVALGFTKGFFVNAILVYILVRFHCTSIGDKKRLIYAYITSATVVSLAALISLTGHILDPEGNKHMLRAHGFFASPNYLSMYLEPALAALGALILQTISNAKEKVHHITKLHITYLAASASIITLGFLAARSYAGWLAIALTALIITGLSKIPYKKMVITIALLCMSAGIASQWNSPKLQNIINPDTESSASSRAEIYTVALYAIKERPWFGLGPGQFDGDAGAGSINYWDGFAHKILGHPPQDTEVLHAHNIFLSTYIFFGLPGLLALTMLIGDFLAKHITRREQGVQIKRNIPFIKSNIALAMMLPIVIHGLFDTTIWKNDLSVIFWMILALI